MAFEEKEKWMVTSTSLKKNLSLFSFQLTDKQWQLDTHYIWHTPNIYNQTVNWIDGIENIFVLIYVLFCQPIYFDCIMDVMRMMLRLLQINNSCVWAVSVYCMWEWASVVVGYSRLIDNENVLAMCVVNGQKGKVHRDWCEQMTRRLVVWWNNIGL